jgi:hypothetical protein
MQHVRLVIAMARDDFSSLNPTPAAMSSFHTRGTHPSEQALLSLGLAGVHGPLSGQELQQDDPQAEHVALWRCDAAVSHLRGIIGEAAKHRGTRVQVASKMRRTVASHLRGSEARV